MTAEFLPAPEEMLAFNEWLRDAREGLSMDFYEKLLENSKNQYGPKAIDHISEAIFKAYNVKIDFKRSEDHKKLLTEPGIIFANHPGIFDIPIVLEALKDSQGHVRSDVKILVHTAAYKMCADNLGKQYFTELVPGEFRPAKQALDEGIKHIQDGGVFLIFPSGGTEQAGNQFTFYPGVGYMLDRLDPKTMAYSFSVNTQDFALAAKAHKKFLPSRSVVAAASALTGLPNINSLRSQRKVRVLENYSLTEDWQRIMVNKNAIEKADELTKHFLELHKENIK